MIGVVIVAYENRHVVNMFVASNFLKVSSGSLRFYSSHLLSLLQSFAPGEAGSARDLEESCALQELLCKKMFRRLVLHSLILWALATGHKYIKRTDSESLEAGHASGKHAESSEDLRTASELGMREDAEEIIEESIEENDEALHFEDHESAKSFLLHSHEQEEAKKHQQFLATFDGMLAESVGGDGEMVVRPLTDDDAATDPPCEARGYLHATFIHADHAAATLVCKPCHIQCKDECTGPEKSDCLQEEKKRGAQASLVQLGSTKSAFTASFHDLLKSHKNKHGIVFVSMSQQHSEARESDWFGQANDSTVDGSGSSLASCLADGSCHSDVMNTTTSSQVNLSSATVEIITDTSLPAPVSDDIIKLSHFNEAVQQQITAAEREAGLLPGMTEEVNFTEDNDSAEDSGMATESGAPNSDPDVGDLVQQNTAPSLLQSCETLHEGRLNASLGARLADDVQYRLKMVSKDYLQTEIKKATKNFAKTYLKDWIAAQEGNCLDALDDVIGVVQEVYGCFKAKYQQFTNAVCKPADTYNELYSLMSSIVRNAGIMKIVANPLQNLPYVGGVAKTLYQVSTQIESTLKPRVNDLEQYKRQQYPAIKDDPQFCKPFPASGWQQSSAYNCAGCNGGSVCTLQTACNTVKGLELKIDAWKAKNFDPLLVKLAEAVQHVQAGANAVNSASWLYTCNGFKTCADLKTLTEKVRSEIESEFLNDRCPLPVPSVPMPNINPLKVVAGFLAQIGSVFDKVKVELMKLHCISVPEIRMWHERQCHRVCFKCCSYKGRRRWAGKVKCSNCCSNACVWVLKSKVTMRRYCFSAMKIMEGISGIFTKFLGPIKIVIEKAINFLLSPIRALFAQILQKIGINVDIPRPNLPSFDFDLPSLPTLSCGALEDYKR